jgi:hypothetical protein
MSTRTWEEQGLVAVVVPSDEEGSFPFRAMDFEDLALANRIVEVGALHDQPITDMSLHDSLLGPFSGYAAATADSR